MSPSAEEHDFSLASAYPLQAEVLPRMDPRLQRFLARARQGMREMASASASEDEVAVIAKVTDRAAWEAQSEVRIGGVFGAPDEDGTEIVTARIPISRIDRVRQLSFVRSLKAAQVLQPTLRATVEETHARADLLPAGHLANGGAGVVVGIVDYGCDFAHRNFRDEGGGTRILSIWHQAGPTRADSPFGYGREYAREEINAALQAADSYDALGYGPRPDTVFSKGSHGTHVMDIAAGNGRGSSSAGVAPNADIVFVDASHADLPFEGPAVIEKSFGDSTRLLEALKYIFDVAGDRPCVINISLGTNGGPHDGSTLVEEGIDRLLREAPNRAVVIAASNSFDDGIHAAGQVVENEHVDLVWEIPTGDFSHNELELWYSGADRVAVELLGPDGTSLLRVDPDANAGLAAGNDDRVVVFVANRLADPNNGDNMIGVFLEAGLPGGNWTVRLHGVSIEDGRFHAWIERDNSAPSRFAPPHDNTHTIGSISCGHEAIVVGSYDGHKPSTPLSYFSSAGPTRDGRDKPETSAPGHNVLAAHSRTETGVVRKSGTSMASPAVTGIIALVLAEVARRNVSLSIGQLRELLQNTARRKPPAGSAWDARFGWGRISAVDALAAVIGRANSDPGDGSGTSRAGKRAARTAKKKKRR